MKSPRLIPWLETTWIGALNWHFLRWFWLRLFYTTNLEGTEMRSIGLMFCNPNALYCKRKYKIKTLFEINL